MHLHRLFLIGLLAVGCSHTSTWFQDPLKRDLSLIVQPTPSTVTPDDEIELALVIENTGHYELIACLGVESTLAFTDSTGNTVEILTLGCQMWCDEEFKLRPGDTHTVVETMSLPAELVPGAVAITATVEVCDPTACGTTGDCHFYPLVAPETTVEYRTNEDAT